MVPAKGYLVWLAELAHTAVLKFLNYFTTFKKSGDYYIQVKILTSPKSEVLETPSHSLTR